MIPIQGVELGTVGGIVLGTVPPVPVAALGDEQFFVSQAPLLLGDTRGLVVRLARAQQILPSLVVLFGADPDIEIGAYPGSGKNMIDRLGGHGVESLADG